MSNEALCALSLAVTLFSGAVAEWLDTSGTMRFAGFYWLWGGVTGLLAGTLLSRIH